MRLGQSEMLASQVILRTVTARERSAKDSQQFFCVCVCRVTQTTQLPVCTRDDVFSWKCRHVSLVISYCVGLRSDCVRIFTAWDSAFDCAGKQIKYLPSLALSVLLVPDNVWNHLVSLHSWQLHHLRCITTTPHRIITTHVVL